MTATPGGIFTHTWNWGTCSGCPHAQRTLKGATLCPKDCPGKYPEIGKRQGMLCRILATGKMNAVHLEFEDGYRVVTCRYGLRRVSDARARP